MSGYVSSERVKVFLQWVEDGANIAEVYIEETKKREIECFYTYRLNKGPHTEHRELAEARPDWLITGERMHFSTMNRCESSPIAIHTSRQISRTFNRFSIRAIRFISLIRD